MPKISQNLNLLSQVLYILLAFAVFHYEFHGSDLPSKLSAPLVHLRSDILSAVPWIRQRFISHGKLESLHV